MTDSKSVKLAFDCVGGDFERAGEASSKIKRCCSVWEFRQILYAVLPSAPMRRK